MSIEHLYRIQIEMAVFFFFTIQLALFTTTKSYITGWLARVHYMCL